MNKVVIKILFFLFLFLLLGRPSSKKA